VPDSAVIGEVNGGWRVAQTMLNFERKMIGDGSMTGGARSAGPPERLVRLVRETGRTGDTHARQLVADVWIQNVVAAEAAALVLAEMRQGKASAYSGAALKLLGNEVTYHRSRAALALAGPEAVAWSTHDPKGNTWADMYLLARGAGIGGGTDEIQKNIIAERIIGLPPEPRDDRDIPFRDIPTSRRS
jgi:alkylation response protein AidB-like acyl-CoA dehydrogenase